MITTNFTTCNATVVVANQTFVISLDDANKAEFTALVSACNASDNEENRNSLIAWLTIAQDSDKTEVINDTFLFDKKTDRCYFTDDTKKLFEIPTILVDFISDLNENGISATPIINFFKRLRKNPHYSLDFANKALESLMNTYLDGDRHVELVKKGYCDEVAYCDASKAVFTLTSDGNVVAYKSAMFKNHKYDTTTGEKIDRYPFSYDEETGKKIVAYPSVAEAYKFSLTSEKINLLKQIDYNNHYVVGQVINQSKGQPGFEKEETSLRFYGQNYIQKFEKQENNTYAKVLITPETITSFGAKRIDNVASPIFLITEFEQAPSSAEIVLTELNAVSDAYCQKFYSDLKESVDNQHKAIVDRIEVVKSL